MQGPTPLPSFRFNHSISGFTQNPHTYRIELAIYKHWDVSLFLSAQQGKQPVLEYVLTVPLGSPGGWGLHGEGYLGTETH